jgi:uncharacterized membrane protein
MDAKDSYNHQNARNRHPLDLIFIFLITFSYLASSLFLPGSFINAVLSLPIIILFPGYVLMSLLWPENTVATPVSAENQRKTTSKGPNNIERISLSFGMSLAIISLIGIGLNYVWDLSLVSILTSLTLFIITISGLCWYRRMQIPKRKRFSVNHYFNHLFVLPGKKEDRIMAIIFIISIVISAITLTYIFLNDIEGENYTEFYILGPNNTIESLPNAISTNDASTIVIGTISHEYENTQYRVDIEINNRTGARQNQTIFTYDLLLEHEEKNETDYSFQIGESGDYIVNLKLFKIGNDIPYRNLHFWIEAYDDGVSP